VTGLNWNTKNGRNTGHS